MKNVSVGHHVNACAKVIWSGSNSGCTLGTDTRIIFLKKLVVEFLPVLVLNCKTELI